MLELWSHHSSPAAAPFSSGIWISRHFFLENGSVGCVSVWFYLSKHQELLCSLTDFRVLLAGKCFCQHSFWNYFVASWSVFCIFSTILEEEKLQQKERNRMEMRRQVTVSWDSGGSDEAPPKVRGFISTPVCLWLWGRIFPLSFYRCTAFLCWFDIKKKMFSDCITNQMSVDVLFKGISRFDN